MHLRLVCLVSAFFASLFVIPALATGNFPVVEFEQGDHAAREFAESCPVYRTEDIEITGIAPFNHLTVFIDNKGMYYTNHIKFGCAGPLDLGPNIKMFSSFLPLMDDWVLMLGSVEELGKPSLSFNQEAFIVFLEEPGD